MTTLATLPPLPVELQQHTDTHELVKADIFTVIKGAIRNHPRSLQKRIGPSEVDHECARRIAYTLLGHERVNVADDVPWLPTVGTGVHGWLEDQFTRANEGLDQARWLVEMPVSVGAILGVDITGHADLYDRVTCTVNDWKIVGPTTLRKYKSKGPGRQYRGQAHLYGRGFTRRGLRVDRVMITFLPRNAELRDAFVWSEPYDEQIALDALQRAEGIALTVQTLGLAGLNHLATADAYCSRCPFYRAGSTDLATGCPGDPGARIPHGSEPALTLT